MRLLVLSTIVAGALGVHCVSDPYRAAPLDVAEDTDGTSSRAAQLTRTKA